jgi:hypothetical protein
MGTLDWLPGIFKVKVARHKQDGDFLRLNGKFRPTPAIHPGDSFSKIIFIRRILRFC